MGFKEMLASDARQMVAEGDFGEAADYADAAHPATTTRLEALFSVDRENEAEGPIRGDRVVVHVPFSLFAYGPVAGGTITRDPDGTPTTYTVDPDKISLVDGMYRLGCTRRTRPTPRGA